MWTDVPRVAIPSSRWLPLHPVQTTGLPEGLGAAILAPGARKRFTDPDSLHQVQLPSRGSAETARCCHGVQTGEPRVGAEGRGSGPGARKCRAHEKRPKEPLVRFGATDASTSVARAPVCRPLRARPTLPAARRPPIPGYPRLSRPERLFHVPVHRPSTKGPGWMVTGRGRGTRPRPCPR
jgi:hypothetical protein